MKDGSEKIAFYEVGLDDVDLLVKMRVEFVAELRSCDDENTIEDMSVRTREYLADEIARSKYLGFIGKIGNKPVCCAGLLIYRLPPLIHSANRVQGHVLNVFTYPQYRHVGYGSRMVEFVIQKAKDSNVNRLFLSTTPIGEGLYKKLGFEADNTAMILNL